MLIALLVGFLVLFGTIDYTHASPIRTDVWAYAHDQLYGWWKLDTADNADGTIRDDMVYGSYVDGYADLVTQSIGLYTAKLPTFGWSWNMYTYGSTHDHFYLEDLNNPGATGEILGLTVNLSYSGLFSGGCDSYPDTCTGSFGFWISEEVGGSLYNWIYYRVQAIYANDSSTWSDVISVPITGIAYGDTLAVGMTLNIGFTGQNGQAADFLNTAGLSFSSTDPSLRLGVRSEGGYSQGYAVPEPSTLLLLGSGLAGIAVWRKRLVRKEGSGWPTSWESPASRTWVIRLLESFGHLPLIFPLSPMG